MTRGMMMRRRNLPSLGILRGFKPSRGGRNFAQHALGTLENDGANGGKKKQIEKVEMGNARGAGRQIAKVEGSRGFECKLAPLDVFALLLWLFSL